MPAIPALIMAGGSIAGAYASSKIAQSAQEKAMQRTPEELRYMQNQSDLAAQMKNQGQQLFGAAMPGVRSTLDYYQSLLSGDRQARMNAVSAETQDVSNAYQGSENAIRRNLRGGERDQALAENAQGRAGQIARLVTGVRPGAASAIAGLAPGLIGQGTQASGEAGNLYGSLLGNETQNRQGAFNYGAQMGSNAARMFGALIGSLGDMYSKNKGQGGGGGNRYPTNAPQYPPAIPVAPSVDIGPGALAPPLRMSNYGPYASGYRLPDDSVPPSLAR